MTAPPNIEDIDDAPVVARRWPTLEPVALQGIAGEIVNAIEATTEADPAALLICLLAAVGVWIGPGPYMWVANTKHPAIVWPLVVGRTSSGAKGTGTDLVLRLLAGADHTFQEHVTSGLSSGEGLIEIVRDPSGEDPTAKDFDPGVVDKRLLVVESEYAAVLYRQGRVGSTLGPVLRDAWDGKPLRVLNRKSNKLAATDHHIAVIGHVTPGELVIRLEAADLAGGTINRWLLVLSKRSKMLPEGGNLDPVTAKKVSNFLAAAKRSAELSVTGLYKRTEAAEAHWRTLYPSLLTEKGEGREAQSTARAVPQVLRLALCFALLDCSPGLIEAEHLEAAAAVWRYAEASAAYVFGDPAAPAEGGLSERLVNFIARAGGSGVTMTQISREHFKGHRKSNEVRLLLKSLLETGYIDQTVVATPGRNRTVFRVRKNRNTRSEPEGRGNENVHEGPINGELSLADDRFPQSTRAGGERPPQVNELISLKSHNADPQNGEPMCLIPNCGRPATNYRPDLPDIARCTEHRAERMTGAP